LRVASYGWLLVDDYPPIRFESGVLATDGADSAVVPGAPTPDPREAFGPPWPRLVGRDGYTPPSVARWPVAIGVLLVAATIVSSAVGAAGSSHSQSALRTISTLGAKPSAPGDELTPDQRLARAQLLTKAEFPPGWTASGDGTVGTSSDQNKSSLFTTTQFPDLTTCLGLPTGLSVRAAEASSPWFTSPDRYSAVLETADIYASPTAAKADFPPLRNPSLPGCTAQIQASTIVAVLRSTYPPGATFGKLTASPGSFPSYGDESGMVVVEVPVKLSDDTRLSVVISFVLIREGRLAAQLVLGNEDTPFDSALAQTLAERVSARMKAAQGSS
jgi:hypothetical protein